MQHNSDRPLCVGLDGALIKTDVLWETLCQFLKVQPWGIFLLPFWLLRGEAWFKTRIAAGVDLDPELLPYSEHFIEFLREQKRAGQALILVTAANQRSAALIAEYLGLFDRVYSSDDDTILSVGRMRKRLLTDYGAQGFDYAGNAKGDLAILRLACTAILVNPRPGVEAAAKGMGRVQRVFHDRPGGLRPYLRAMRVHQWSKNLLVFVPLILSHRIDEPTLVIEGILAFCAFSLCASSVYLLNDLLDLAADRRHPSKGRRPFAAGDIDLRTGALLMLGLLPATGLIASPLALGFLGLLSLYYVTALGYSFHLKQTALVDVMALAGLYVLRILAGSAAVGVEASFWLLAFSMFFFLSLALVKRYSELRSMGAVDGAKSAGRPYVSEDLETLSLFGTASGYMAVLVLALYISSDEVNALYTQPETIWLLCPLLLYWISRVWLMARRGGMHEDPVVFALQDRTSHLLAMATAFTLWAAL